MYINSTQSSYTNMMQGVRPPPPPSSQQLAEEFITSYDSDNDGSISSDEFSTAAKANGIDSSQISELFSLLDGNGEGSISSEELLSALEQSRPRPPQGMGPPPPPPQQGKDGLEELFSSLDSDEDGTLSVEEFLAQSEDQSTQNATGLSLKQTLHNHIFESMVNYYSNAQQSSFTA